MRPRVAVDAIARYRVVPSSLLRAAAVGLLLLESTLAAALLLDPVLPPVATRVSLLTTAVLFAAFAAVAAHAQRMENPVPCGCLGDVVELRLGWTAVLLNLTCSLAAGVAALLPLDTTALPSTWIVTYESAALVSAVYWLTIYGSSVRGAVGGSLTTRART
jgi:hypothetical protein